ncbi:MAG: hypothetical protein U1F36_09060 [Planctomycetota bacterium]
MAAPHPEKELDRLQAQLGNGVPALTVITGPAGFFRNEAFEAVMRAVQKDVDVRRIDGSDDTDGRELQDLMGATLFGAGTVVGVPAATRGSRAAARNSSRCCRASPRAVPSWSRPASSTDGPS